MNLLLIAIGAAPGLVAIKILHTLLKREKAKNRVLAVAVLNNVEEIKRMVKNGKN
jgi:hypothetical protein